MKKVSFFNQSNFRKLKLTTFSILASTSLLVSCGDTEEPDPIDPPKPGDELTIDAARTDWHSTWVDSDMIGVINSKTTTAPFAFDEGTFFVDGKLTATDSPEVIFAFYPHSRDLAYTPVDGEALVAYNYTLPLEQTIKYNTNGSVDMANLRKASFMCGATTSKLASEATIPMVMHNINSTVKLQISGLIPESVVKSVVVSGGAVSSKSAAITISTEDGTFTSVPLSGEESSVGEIIVNLDGAKVSSEGVLDVFVSVLPQTIVEETTWNVKIMGESEQLGEIAIVPITHTAYEAGKAYDLPVTIISYDKQEITLDGTKSLEQVLADLNQDVNKMSHLTLMGDVTEADIIYTRDFEVLKYLNLEKTTMTALPQYLYSDDKKGSSNDPNPFKDLPTPAAHETLQEVFLPENMTVVNGWIFERCERLKVVHVPDGVVEFRASVFEGCEALHTASIPEGVTKIGSWCFESTRISDIVVPAGVSWIGSGTFAGLKEYRGVKSVTFMREDPTDCFFASTNIFSSISTTIAIRVPQAGLEKWKAVEKLSTWSGQMVGFE